MITLTEEERELWRAVYCAASSRDLRGATLAAMADNAVLLERERLPLPNPHTGVPKVQREPEYIRHVDGESPERRAHIISWNAGIDHARGSVTDIRLRGLTEEPAPSPEVKTQTVPAPWAECVDGWVSPPTWEVPETLALPGLMWSVSQLAEAAGLNGYPDACVSSTGVVSTGLHEDDPRRSPVQPGTIELVHGDGICELGFEPLAELGPTTDNDLSAWLEGLRLPDTSRATPEELDTIARALAYEVGLKGPGVSDPRLALIRVLWFARCERAGFQAAWAQRDNTTPGKAEA